MSSEDMYIERVSHRLLRLSESGSIYNFECPFCHEGKSAGRKKRAQIYKNTEYSFYCFNCSASYSFSSFLYELDRSVYYQYKEENKENKFYDNNIFLKKTKEEPSAVLAKPIVTLTLDDKLIGLSTKFTKFMYPLRDSSVSYGYLRGRRVEESVIDKLLYYFNDQDHKIIFNKSIVFPFYNRGYESYYGFQSRQLSNKIFHIELQDENYPKIYNLFNIDNTKPVYIFEGFFDSIVIDNSIALNGADIPEKYMRMIQTPVFVFDNDETGFKKSIKYAEKGFDVFIYPENFKYKDFNEFYCKEKLEKSDMSDFIKSNIFKSYEASMMILDRQIR